MKQMNNPKANAHPNCYHDPVRLLKTYRDVRWNLKLSMEQHRLDFEKEFGMSITEYLDDVYAAGAEFTGTKLEHHANNMKRTAEMLKLIDNSIHLIREYNSEGEILYWVLFYTYLSPQKLRYVKDIVKSIKMHIPYISKDNYFKLKKKAITIFSSVLWGFTTKEEVFTLDIYVDETTGLKRQTGGISDEK